MKKLIFLLAISLLFIQCKKETADVVDVAYTQEFNSWANQAYEAFLARSPISQSYLGIKDNQDKWDNMSDAEQDIILDMRKKFVKELKDFNTGKLGAQAKITHRLMLNDLEQDIANDKFRHYNYPAHQMRGVHDFIPSFLINIHKITAVIDAEAYISRLEKSGEYLDQAITNLKTREEKGILPPLFVFEHIINSSQNIIKGYPFDGAAENSPLYADFEEKVNALTISAEEKQELVIKGKNAMMEQLKPGYDRLIETLLDQQKVATIDDGVWKMKDGESYYTARLAQMTTTNLTPADIFDTGMAEVERIHGEMRDIMKKVNFDGDLQDFFTFMRTDKQFYFPNTTAGKKQYLDKAKDIIAEFQKEIDGLFITKPKANFIVKAVEPFREKSAGKAFYQGPALDGSRPGTYYANLYDMSQMPTYQMEALAYHEAIPGHHMQIAIAQELEGLPKYRTQEAHYTAYSEGWGLYSEYIPKELGFYQDPYSDFGRLAMELWRSCRLVADVGIHHKKWTRQKAIDFYKENTPNPEGDCIKMVERHIVMPGQATAYKIGQLKILELREKAKIALGEKFDIRKFHDVVLTNGPVPLNVLEELVDQYIGETEKN